MKKIIPAEAVLIPDHAERVFKGVIFDVYQWPQEMFDGSEATFEMLKRPDTVSSICVVDGKVLVLNEEQPNLGKRRNFPGGRVDPTDKSIVAATQREVLEETGYSFKNWRVIKVWQPHGKFEWFIYLVLAWDGEKHAEPHLDAGEKIIVEQLPFEELKHLVMTRAGYLSEALEIFENLNSLDELLALPEFTGREVDR